MKNLGSMMKQAQQVQQKMQDMQAKMADMEVQGSSGGGMVSVTLTGKGQMKGLKIDPSLITPDDVEMLEDLIVAAHNEAKEKVERETQEQMKDVTGGLPLPDGFKLPF